MKYKVGDKVRIKSLEWYNSNKDNDGNVPLIEMCDALYNFVEDMHCFCGKIVTIHNVCHRGYYDIKEDDCCWYWTDEMIECLFEPITTNEYTKMVSLDRIVEYLDSELYTTCDYFGNVQTASRDSINKKEFIEKLCKAMED